MSSVFTFTVADNMKSWLAFVIFCLVIEAVFISLEIQELRSIRSRNIPAAVETSSIPNITDSQETRGRRRGLARPQFSTEEISFMRPGKPHGIVGNRSIDINSVSPEILNAAHATNVVMNSAEYKRLCMLQRTESQDIRYGLLARALAVDSEKQAEFFRLLESYEMVEEDVANAMNSRTIPRGVSADEMFRMTQSAVTEEKDRIQNQITNLLGVSGDKYNSISSSVAQLAVVEQLQKALFDGSNQLSEEQSILLQTVLIDGEQRQPTSAPSLVVLPCSSRTASMVLDGKMYAQVAPNTVYVYPDGGIFPSLTISEETKKKVYSLLDDNQRAMFNDILGQLDAAHEISKGYY